MSRPEAFARYTRRGLISTLDLHGILRENEELQSRLLYFYDMLGCLSDWKVNAMSITAIDSKGNRVRFPLDKPYPFVIDAFAMAESEVTQ